MATFLHTELTRTCIFLLASVQLSFGLQCYQCSSPRDEFCDDKFSVQSLINVPLTSCENSPRLPIPGAGLNTHCAKSKRRDVKSSVYVTRGCVPENYCRLVESYMSECLICEESRCNSAISLLPSMFTCLITSTLIYLKL